MKPRVIFVRKSTSAKLGGLPCTYSQRDTCPPQCPLMAKGCYAQAGFHTRLAWNRADSAPDTSWNAMLESVRKLPEGTAWRHNVAGDLPGSAGVIDCEALSELAEANAGRAGFTYTHYPPEGGNLEALAAANAAGFVVNLSADNLEEADACAATGLPTVTLLEHATGRPTRTPGGRVVIVCPEASGRRPDCASCGLCWKSDRKVIVGFPVHGTQSKAAAKIAAGKVG